VRENARPADAGPDPRNPSAHCGSVGGRPRPTVAAYKHQGTKRLRVRAPLRPFDGRIAQSDRALGKCFSRCGDSRGRTAELRELPNRTTKPAGRTARPDRPKGSDHGSVPMTRLARAVPNAQSIQTGLPAAHPPRAEGSTPSPRSASTCDAGVKSAPATRTARGGQGHLGNDGTRTHPPHPTA
jgi:hypothetical protein